MMSARAKATATQIEDNDRVKITEWRFGPGAETGWHLHAMDYIVIYRTAAHLVIESKQGESSVQMAEGQLYFRKAGVEHNVINFGGTEVVFLEVELK
jgi:mannose-6-phosphate isomerase-like protein (cupin superfamily)